MKKFFNISWYKRNFNQEIRLTSAYTLKMIEDNLNESKKSILYLPKINYVEIHSKRPRGGWIRLPYLHILRQKQKTNIQLHLIIG